MVTREEAFVRSLAVLVERGDRAALAALRRGLGKAPGVVTEMDRHVVPWLRGDQPVPQDAAFYLVASLFAAWHQGRDAVEEFSGSLGKSLRVMADDSPERHAGVERRLMAILASHSEELPTHLRHAVSLLRSGDVPVDWCRLLGDLARWDHPDRIVQRRWARDFWHEPASPPAGEQTADETEQP
ncbi:MAG: type I-E CRISPR-associated protein Cse2/CasB [Candidatus Rokuibacteriota bacterium]